MATSSAAPFNILLVDDNRDGLLVRRTLLEECGYLVQIACNGEEALKLFETSPYDVVVTDYRMPRMDGIELIRRMRQVNPLTRVILLSGFVEPLGLTEENTGADAVVAKSSNEPAQLMRSVKRLTRKVNTRKPPGSQKAAAARATRIAR
jgi:CheY-like chemotaxis protein